MVAIAWARATAYLRMVAIAWARAAAYLRTVAIGWVPATACVLSVSCACHVLMARLLLRMYGSGVLIATRYHPEAPNPLPRSNEAYDA